VLIIRWFLDRTRLAQLAYDGAISTSTAYDYLHEGEARSRQAPPDSRAANWPTARPANGPRQPENVRQ
jgi:hypothetical protein